MKGFSVGVLSSSVLFLSTRNSLVFVSFFNTNEILIRKFIFSLKFILPTIGTGYVLLSTVKALNYSLNKLDENRLKNLIGSIDRFDLCCRKILLFLNDSQHLRAIHQQVGSENEMVQNVIQSILDVTKLIWNEIKNLDKQYELPSDFCYEPMDDLEDCEFLKKTDFDNKDVKVSSFYLCSSLCL